MYLNDEMARLWPEAGRFLITSLNLARAARCPSIPDWRAAMMGFAELNPSYSCEKLQGRILQTSTTILPPAWFASITRCASRMSSKRNTREGFAL